jgi:heme exporter protein C
LHQPASVARLDGPAIDAAILLPLLWMAGSFLLLFILLVLLRTETEMDRRRLENAEEIA